MSSENSWIIEWTWTEILCRYNTCPNYSHLPRLPAFSIDPRPYAARYPLILNRKHVGRPYEYQCKLARQMIDATASAVVGSHTHVTQTVETYRGKPIV